MKNNGMTQLEQLKETHFLSLYDAHYCNKKGEPKHWIIASRKKYNALQEIYFNKGEEKTDAVVIAAYHEETQKIVLIKQFRMPLNSYVYELPAGLIDPDENLKTTLERELKEETGLEVVAIKRQTDKLYLSPGMTDESVALMYCMCKGELSEAYMEADEDITPVLLSKEEAKELMNSNEKMDIKAHIVLDSFIRLGADLFYN